IALLLLESPKAMPRMTTKPISAENRSTQFSLCPDGRVQDKLPPVMIQAIDEAVAFVRSKSKLQPSVGVVLGSGLGNVVDALDVETTVPYNEIPGGAASTVWGHSGKMILGRAGKLPVVVLAGRMHYYEGHDMRAVVHLA